LKCLLAIVLWSTAVVGYLYTKVNAAERIYAVASAALLIAALPLTDEIGFAMSAGFIVWHLLKVRRQHQAAANAEPALGAK
jgi:TRAP-type uncharacterized transport system fused permease subunit